MTWVITRGLVSSNPYWYAVGPVTSIRLSVAFQLTNYMLATSLESARNLVPCTALYDPTYRQHWPAVVEAWVVPGT